jgi:hypothetical protein
MTVHTQRLGATPLPAPNLGNLGKLDAEDVVGAFLVSSDAPDGQSSLNRKLKPLLADADVHSALAVLERKGFLKPAAAESERAHQGRRRAGGSESKVVLTAEGHGHFRKLLGIDKAQPWEAILKGGLAAVAVGYRPSRANWTASLDTLAPLVVATCFGLARRSTSAKEVASGLVWKILGARLPELIALESLPVENELDRHSRAVLLSFAGLKSGNVPTAMAVLAARCVGLAKKADAKGLSMALVQQAIRLPLTSPEPKAPEPRAAVTFAKKVLDVAAELRTPPFDGSVAIAQVYDAYGEQHDDAGTLADFKRRLVAAAKRRELSLQRLDLPDLMSLDLRERSQTPLDNDVVHFVVVKWL